MQAPRAQTLSVKWEGTASSAIATPGASIIGGLEAEDRDCHNEFVISSFDHPPHTPPNGVVTASFLRWKRAIASQRCCQLGYSVMIAIPLSGRNPQQLLFLNRLIVAATIDIHKGRNYLCRVAVRRCRSSSQSLRFLAHPSS